MDSRESLEPPPKRHQPHHQNQQLPPGMMMPPNTSTARQPHHFPNNSNNNNNSIVTHDFIQPARKNIDRPRKYSPSPDVNITLGLALCPVISGGGTPNSDSAAKKHRERPRGSGKKQMDPLVPRDSIQQRFAFDGCDQCGDESSRPGESSTEPARKNIDRPRKYSPSPDVNITLGLALCPVISGGRTPNSDSAAKKHRERPRGSGKKQMDPLGSAGVGFTPHLITVKVGEDIATKMTPFTQQGDRTVCILSANGAINNVTLFQPAMLSNTVTYKGRFEIISLSGIFNSNGSIIYTCFGRYCVSLAASDGRVLGGIVVGCLVAATPIQVFVGSFIIDTKIPKPLNMRNFRIGPGPGASPPSDGEPSSESSDDSGSCPHQPPPPQPQDGPLRNR